MENNQAMQIIINSVEKGFSKGCYNMSESAVILKAFETLGVKLPEFNAEENVQEENENTKKQIKD